MIGVHISLCIFTWCVKGVTFTCNLQAYENQVISDNNAMPMYECPSLLGGHNDSV